MMRVGVIGLGLIGGSMAKAYKRDPRWEVYGGNRSKSIVDFAMIAQAIDAELTDEILPTLDLSAVPVLKELTHLPVVVDPSHATGKASLVNSMALAAVAAGADGLMIEVHNDPLHALSDGAQSLTPEAFDDLAKRILKIREVLV